MPFKGAVFLRFLAKKSDALNGQLDFFVMFIAPRVIPVD